MKKVLSFVLVLAMILGSVGMVFAADFTDQASITNTEAAKVLAGAGIIEGYTDGSFKPAQTLTRAEGAAIAARMLLGKTEAAKLTTVVSPFNDVPATHWAAGYVSYCVAQGLLNGYGNGNFGPDDTLSVAAFGKMMLTALGYKSENEGFIGDAWETNVGSIMVKAGLTDGLTISGTNSCSREVAAQVALNTLKATMVKYTGTATTVSTGNVTVTTGYSPAEKQNWMNDAQSGDKANYIPDNALGALVRPIRFMNRYQSKLERTDDVADSFGRPTTYKWNYDGSKVYSKTNTDDLIATYTTKQTQKTIYNLLSGKDAINNSTTISAFWNGYKLFEGKTNAGAAVNLVKNSGDTFSNKATDGTQVEVYYNSSNKLVTVVMYDYLLVKATADYNSNKEYVLIQDKYANASVAAINKINKEDFDVTGVKEDDHLIVTWATGAGFKSVAPATEVTGVVSGLTQNSKATIDGTTYSKSGNMVAGALSNANVSVGSEVTLVLDPNNYVLESKDGAASKTYAYLKKAAKVGGVDTEIEAELYFADGTRQVVKLTKVDTADADTCTNITPGAYSYSVNSNGKYKLTSKEFARKGTDVTNGAVTFTNAPIATNKASNDTSFIVIKGTSNIKVYSGYKKVPSVNGANITVAAVENNTAAGYAKYAWIDTIGAGANFKGAETSDYVLIYGKATTAADEVYINDTDSYYTYGKAFINGENKAIEFTSDSPLPTGAIGTPAGLYKELTYNADGRIDGATKVNASIDEFVIQSGVTTGAGISYNADALVVNGAEYKTADGVAVYIIKGTDVDPISVSNIKANMDDAGYYTMYLVYNNTTDKEAKTIFFVKQG